MAQRINLASQNKRTNYLSGRKYKLNDKERKSTTMS